MVGPVQCAGPGQTAQLFDAVPCAETAAKKRGFLKLLEATLRNARRSGLIKDSTANCAIDSTGYEAGHTSSYYGKRCGLKKSRYPKLTTVCDLRSYLYLSAIADSGPKPDDIEFHRAVREAFKLQPFKRLLADAGYDSEKHHRYLREFLGVRSVIPPTRGRPTQKLPRQKYRRRMATHFPRTTYGKRWHIESSFSQDKRRFGSQISAQTYWSQCRELYLRVLVHNIALIWRFFYLLNRAVASPLSLYRSTQEWHSVVHRH